MIVEKVITDASNEKIKDTITLTYHDRFVTVSYTHLTLPTKA